MKARRACRRRLCFPVYWLEPHVHVCGTDEGAVLLDLKKDKYLALSRIQSDALSGAVAGWPGEISLAAEPVRATQLAEKLVAAGVLTRSAERGKRVRPVVLSEVEMGLPVGQRGRRVRIRFSHVVQFVRAVVSAACSLRFRSLESVVNAVAARKRTAARRVDLEKADELVNVFSRLRTFTYTRRNRCLFDALALVNFLAAHGQYPHWVIGVRSRPFMAHSWVQEGALVFDAAPDVICELIPIVAV